MNPESINALLPQTQCQQCGYDACLPYAKALIAGEKDISLCAPGGEKTLLALAELLERDPEPYRALVLERYRAPSVAVIDESHCIGCMKCIQACPVDAIVGARKMMHTVLADRCTGCELCLLPCPTDCIQMIHLDQLLSEQEQATRAQQAAQHYQDKNTRQEKSKFEQTQTPKTQSDLLAEIKAARQRVLANKGS